MIQATNWWDCTREYVDMDKKRNRKRETGLLLRVAKNKVIKTNYTKAKIDNTGLKSECRLCWDRKQLVNHIIS